MYPAEVTGVRVLDGFRVELRFRDGAEKTVDPEPELRTISWPNGADIDPDVLRWDLRPAT